MVYLVGVDSGGTHTNIKIKAPDGTEKPPVGAAKSLTSNRSDEELREISRDIFLAIHGHTGGDHACVWIAAAGYAASSKDRLEGLIAASITDLNMRVGIANDAVTLLLANDPELVVVIAGTGSVAMARNPLGQVITRGGDEWVAADYGSAFWLGLNGIRAAYRALDGGGPDTTMRHSLLERWRKDEDKGEPDLIIGKGIARYLAGKGTDTKPEIASFARYVTDQAELGDEVAQKIVRNGVDELAGAAARVYRGLAAQAQGRLVLPRFLLSGSLGHLSPFYREAFRASLDQFLFDARKKTSNEKIEFRHQLNGLSDALKLAGDLAEGKAIPKLDKEHPVKILNSPNYILG